MIENKYYSCAVSVASEKVLLCGKGYGSRTAPKISNFELTSKKSSIVYDAIERPFSHRSLKTNMIPECFLKLNFKQTFLFSILNYGAENMCSCVASKQKFIFTKFTTLNKVPYFDYCNII